MDFWTHLILNHLRHANHAYWYICMKKLHTDGSFGLTWFLNHLRHANHTAWARWLKGLVFSKMELESNLLEVMHFDVCNPMSAEACSGYRYVLTSQMIWVDVEYIYLMNHESELLKGSSNFRVKLNDRRDKRIKYLWYDHRDEYLNYEFGTELRHCGNCFTTNTAWNTIVWWCVRTS
jgi:hypothetical protein